MNKEDKITEYSEYYEIVTRLIYQNNILSVAKLIFIAFAVRNLNDTFVAKNQKYGLMEFLKEGLRKGFQKSFEEFESIFFCLKLLEENEIIEIKDGAIVIIRKLECTKEQKIMDASVIKEAIREMDSLSEKSFIKGVIECLD